ncbi:MAG: tryptophan synthase subunit alpha [Gammaproteobacteria bacterium]|nr:MAG: tryptophan synthase subunit alpha [Gammaproteobacteria bacterium]
MSRLATRFAERRDAGSSTLVTYLIAGDPAPSVTVAAMEALARAGVDVIEIGIPFSDPEAEGPDIQAGCERALAHGVRLRDVLDMVATFRQTDTRTAVVLMGYLNSVEAMGSERFAEAASEAGVDGVILVNLPPEEAGPLRSELEQRGIDLVFLLAPTTTDARAQRILEQASGFVYYVSLKGTTGAGHLDVDAVRERVTALRSMTPLPIAVGFGIRDGASARRVAQFADGVVVGSVLVRSMGDLAGAPEAIPAAAEALARELREAMDAA